MEHPGYKEGAKVICQDNKLTIEWTGRETTCKSIEKDKIYTILDLFDGSREFYCVRLIETGDIVFRADRFRKLNNEERINLRRKQLNVETETTQNNMCLV